MMTRRIISRTALWLAALAVIAAFWLMSDTVLLLSLLLTVALLPAVSFLLNFTVRRKLSFSLLLQPTSRKNASAQCVLRTENRGFLPARALVRLRFTNALTKEQSETLMPVTIPAKGKSNISFTAESARCGQLLCEAESAWLLDVFGFLPLRAVFSKEVSRMTVLPDTFAPEIELSVPMAAPDDSEYYSADRPGYDLSELFQLREYTPGDELRRIHWKLSGKLDRLIVRDPGLPLRRSLLVFWDKTASNKFPAVSADTLCEAIASVTQALSDDGCLYTLGWPEEGRLILEDIDSTEALLSVLPRLIRSRDEGESGTELLCDSSSESFYGRVLLFAHDVPPMLDVLCEKGEVTLFLCSEHEAAAPCATLRFTERNYRTILQNPEL